MLITPSCLPAYTGEQSSEILRPQEQKCALISQDASSRSAGDHQNGFDDGNSRPEDLAMALVRLLGLSIVHVNKTLSGSVMY
jgi:hypothetical protein